MAFYVVVINSEFNTIDQLNGRYVDDSSKAHEGVNLCANFLQALTGGVEQGTIQVTTRDTDPTVTTSGTDSKQVLYNLK